MDDLARACQRTIESRLKKLGNIAGTLLVEKAARPSKKVTDDSKRVEALAAKLGDLKPENDPNICKRTLAQDEYRIGDLADYIRRPTSREPQRVEPAPLESGAEVGKPGG